MRLVEDLLTGGPFLDVGLFTLTIIKISGTGIGIGETAWEGIAAEQTGPAVLFRLQTNLAPKECLGQANFLNVRRTERLPLVFIP